MRRPPPIRFLANPRTKLIVKLGRAYNRLPLEMLDPRERRYWGMQRAMIDAAIAAELVTDERLDAGDTRGVSVKRQVQHHIATLDLSEHNQLEEFKAKLRVKG